MKSVLSDLGQSISTPEPQTHALLAADQTAEIDKPRPIVDAAHMKEEHPISVQRQESYSSAGSVRSQAMIAPTSSAVMCLK
jgi:hypothetical protein